MFPYTNQFGFDFFFFKEWNAKKLFCDTKLGWWQEIPKSRTWEVRLREGTSFPSGLGPSERSPEHFVIDQKDEAGGEESSGRHLQRPSSCHCVCLNVIYMEFFVFVNLFIWFEFTKEWLIQNCLWQKYTLLWLYSSGSNIVMGLLRGRKLIEFPSNNHNSTFRKFHLLPFMLLTLYPFHC